MCMYCTNAKPNLKSVGAVGISSRNGAGGEIRGVRAKEERMRKTEEKTGGNEGQVEAGD